MKKISILTILIALIISLPTYAENNPAEDSMFSKEGLRKAALEEANADRRLAHYKYINASWNVERSETL
jgi:hypothetical protein